MKSTFAWSLALGASLVLAAACGGEGSGATGGTTAAAATATASATASESATATASASATVSESATASATAPASDAPAASGSASAEPAPSGSAAASGTASAAPAGTATAAAAKKFACGEKGQPNCPMQGWMKSAMGSAVASGDGERIARALETVARKPVAGFGNWSAIALAGAAKARAGDIDGAKESCKKCHDAYKYKYTTTMRDQPW